MALVEKFKVGDIVVVKGIRSPRMHVVDSELKTGHTFEEVHVECIWFTSEDILDVHEFNQDQLELYKAPVTHPMLD